MYVYIDALDMFNIHSSIYCSIKAYPFIIYRMYSYPIADKNTPHASISYILAWVSSR